jgi:hypothetical protein
MRRTPKPAKRIKQLFPRKKRMIIALVGVGLIFTSTVLAEGSAPQPTGPQPQRQEGKPVEMTALWATPVVAGGPAALPGELPHATQPAGKNLWRASMVAVVAANVMDAHSSWGKRELNLNLSANNGKFGPQGALAKLGIVGGMFVLESLVLHHKPCSKFYRSLAVINFGWTSVTGVTAIRNYGVPRP